ncbi:MAG TPA: aldo/keto reductase [Bacteroidales bacterium]|nr:aldo/keto reductase [Bacteroidales bacterium]MDI9574761.1 aldo/keto reductase [Bacteroidota bacterium]OQC60996.1 MAG: 2,5-diketo-D-gluconic acid reductase B [Bacteroidetes bacterium ADurb.Bin012]MBP9512649.1 aldo/keto reductase [Bacteroidales bacterium]MBP9589192.1 aldo/keto reductase [Bacteroidales bacterium]
MIYKKISDYNVPAVGLGTWEMGGGEQADYSHDRHWITIIRSAIENGLTHIDTAEMYGNGHTEELVGEAIKGFPRQNLFITTKVWLTHLRSNDLFSSFEKSLRQLQTDYIDLYLVHHPNPDIPLEETLMAMNRLVEQKRVRAIGVSNFDISLIKEAVRISSVPISAVQIEYSLLARNSGIYTQNQEKEIIPYCQENQIAVIAWRPLGKTNYIRLATNDVIKKIAEKYHATPAQIALIWLIAQKNILAIPKTGSLEHLIENSKASDIDLSMEDGKLLREAFEE